MRHTIAVISLCVLAVIAAAANSRAACPDLQPEGLTLFGPQIVAPGENIGERLLAFVHNVGDTSAGGYSVGIYLSPDEEITTDDELLIGGRDFLDSLPPGAIEPLPVCVSHYLGCEFMDIPPEWTAGTAFIGIIVDEFLSVAECDEYNNVASIPVLVSTSSATVRNVPGTYGTIAAAIAASSDGDTISIAAGEYDEAFAVSSDLVFRGAGWDNTIIRTTVDDNAIVSVTNASVAFEDLQLKAWGSQPYWTSRGIDATGSSVSVTRCKFVEIGNYHIFATGGSVMLDSAHMSNSGIASDVGLRTEGSYFRVRNSFGGGRIDHVYDPRASSMGLIEDNHIEGSPIGWANGVRVRDYSTALIRNNLFPGQHDTLTSEYTAVGAIAVFGTCYAEIYDNEVHDFLYGLNLGSGSTTKLYDNVVTDNVLRGVRVFGTPSPVIDFGGGDLGSPGGNYIYANGDYNVVNEHAGVVYALYNHWNKPDSAAIDSTLWDDDEDPSLGEVRFMPTGVNTGPGTNVAVLTHLGMWFIFSQVDLPGITYVEKEEIGPPLPPVLNLMPSGAGIYYDVHTTAEYTGNIEICIDYEDEDVAGSESDLGVFHYNGEYWVNVTSSGDMDENNVCGTTRSLSYIVLAEETGCCGFYTLGYTGNCNCSTDGKITLSDISRLIDRIYISKTELCCEENGNANGSEDGKLTLSDISAIIDNVYISKQPTAECQ